MKTTAVAALMSVGLLAGCAGGGAIEPESVKIPTASADLDVQGSWLAVDTLHVRGEESDIGPQGLSSFVVAPRTIPFTSDEGKLCFLDFTATSCSNYEPYGSMFVSADGRRLGFLDEAHGAKDQFGTRLLLATVLDLKTGDVLLSTAEGLGDTGDDDLADLYEDAEPTFRGFDAKGEAVYDGVDNKRRGGTVVPRDVPGETRTVAREGEDVTLRSGSPDSSLDVARVSPDGEFAVVVRADAEFDSDYVGVKASGGKPFELSGRDEPWWSFGTWSGPHQFIATTTDEAQSHLGVLECDLKTRSCKKLDQIPIETGDVDAVIFPSTAGTDIGTFDGM